TAPRLTVHVTSRCWRADGAHVDDERAALVAVLDLDQDLTAVRTTRDDRQGELVYAPIEVGRPTQLALIGEAVEADLAGQRDVDLGARERLGRAHGYVDVPHFVHGQRDRWNAAACGF